MGDCNNGVGAAKFQNISHYFCFSGGVERAGYLVKNYEFWIFNEGSG